MAAKAGVILWLPYSCVWCLGRDVWAIWGLVGHHCFHMASPCCYLGLPYIMQSQGSWILSQWLASPGLASLKTSVPRDPRGSCKSPYNLALEVSQHRMHYLLLVKAVTVPLDSRGEKE